MERILLSAFACDPSKGSEPGNGWNWATGLAERGYEVHCLTRKLNSKSINAATYPDNLKFHFISLPFGLERLYKLSQATMYVYYILWQWFAYRYARKLHSDRKFHVAHHVTWGSLQMGSFLYKLPVPFIFGPAGGGQNSPEPFRQYFLEYWKAEVKRQKVSDWLTSYNPAFKKMVPRAHSILVSNKDTYSMAARLNPKRLALTLDAALPISFLPLRFEPKKVEKGLKLLWVGRFMPRKGLLLVLDVMKELKDYAGISLTVVGDGEMKMNIVNKIKEYGLHDSVKLTGTIPFADIGKLYESHHLFFFTSLRDSCPAQLIEALAYGMPIVTIDLHGQGTIVRDEFGIKCACTSPTDAIEGLKNAILSLYRAPDRISSMSVEAHKFALAQTWDSKIAHILTEYYPIQK